MKYAVVCAAIAVLSAGLVGRASSRPISIPGYEDMTRQSDLVVIATPVERRELPGRVAVPGVERENRPIAAIRVETSFRPLVIFKGELRGHQKEFTLLHLREAAPPHGRPEASPPAWVDFHAGSGKAYLMFLRLGNDGRYEPAVGQTDPALSIEQLRNLR
jgi:hypothetical protein